jgi:hypothetical protein
MPLDQANVTGHTWSGEYREIVDFYYWEPQHLGRMKNPTSTITSSDQAWAKVKKLEVSTNHILNLYFSMVPLAVLDPNRRWAPADDYRFVGSGELERLRNSLQGFTQPDLYWTEPTRELAVELKTSPRPRSIRSRSTCSSRPP